MLESESDKSEDSEKSVYSLSASLRSSSGCGLSPGAMCSIKNASMERRPCYDGRP